VPTGSCVTWGALMSRSRSAATASNSVKFRRRWPGWTGCGTGTADPVELRAQLADRLPAYMVPAATVLLDALPLTPNGKLDIRALPAPEYIGAGYCAPTSAVEKVLADAFAQVLGLQVVGIDDSFFDLGGDSLSAMRLIATINMNTDADLSVRTLFDAPTVRSLREWLLTDTASPQRVNRFPALEESAGVPLSAFILPEG
jgi:acyl carrier protein